MRVDSCTLGNKDAEEIKRLGVRGATSNSYLVRIEGREFFMKQLRSELKDDWRYRSAYQKEYEVGRSINDKYIVKYESIDENADGLYILMEHVNGHTLDEKLVQEPEYFSRGDNFEKLFIQTLKGLKAHSRCPQYHVCRLGWKECQCTSRRAGDSRPYI